MTTEAAAPARTLADDLRGRDDDALAALLRARPDLVSPVPTDMTNLVARASTRASVGRAMERFDRFTLQVVDALVYLPDPATYHAVHGLVAPADEDRVRQALDRLREVALVWGDEEALRLVRTVRDVVGPTPAGIGPRLQTVLASWSPSRLRDLLDDLGLPATPAPVSAAESVVALVADPQRFAALVGDAPPQARELLDVLAEGPPTGHVDRADRRVRVATAQTPLEWLLARGLLVALDPITVVLPGDVAVAVRGGRLHREASATPPSLDTTRHDAAVTDSTAAGQAFAAVSRVEELLDAWGVEGPSVLRAGGLGVRDLRRAAVALAIEEPLAALLLETSYAAGLLAPNGGADEVFLPTPEYDRWRALDPSLRWGALARAWLEMARVPALVGTRDERDRPLAALGPDVSRPLAPEVRRETVAQLATLQPGTSATAQSVRERLVWFRPLRGGRQRGELVDATLREAEYLGLTGRGALASFTRPLVEGPGPGPGAPQVDAAAATLRRLLPEPVDHVLIQTDQTAVAPGPLVRGLATELALAADVESTGGATVYRFTDRSIRRALDAGRTAAELHELLRTHSRTPVPQPLTYLVDDVARRHGRIRVGTASAYVRCDDEAVLAELLADRRCAHLRLRRLAPTVLAADASVDALLDRLRELGYAPAAESPDGAVVVRRPDARRTPQRPPAARLTTDPPTPGATLLGAAVRALRAGDRAARGIASSWRGAGDGFGRLPRTGTVVTLDRLRQAADTGTPLWIGYLDNHGSATGRLVDPIAVEGGYLTAYDHRLDRVHSFAIHRITGAAPLPPPPPPP
jgi:hypothetical protein